jgi:hypothetical protein
LLGKSKIKVKGDGVMNHMKALVIKFISSLVILYVVLGLLYDMSFSNVFLITLVLGVASYILGDMLILPRTNNTVATLADFGLAFLVIWLMGESLTYGDSLVTPALIAAAGMAIFEYFFHKYVSNQVIKQEDNNRYQAGNRQFQTEASEELTPTDRKNQNKNNK